MMAKLKEVAEEEDRPVSELIRRAVERFLEMKSSWPKKKVAIPTFSGGVILVSSTYLKQAIYEADAP